MLNHDPSTWYIANCILIWVWSSVIQHSALFFEDQNKWKPSQIYWCLLSSSLLCLSFSRFRHKFLSPLLLRKHLLMMWTVTCFPSENLGKAALRKWKWAQILLCSWPCSWLIIGYFCTFCHTSNKLIMKSMYDKGLCPTYWSSTFEMGHFLPWDGTFSYLSYVMCLYAHSACTTAWMNYVFYTGSYLLDHHLICSVNFRIEGLSVWHMKPPWRVCFAKGAQRPSALAPMKAVPLSLSWKRERWCQSFEFF